jgi:hypothetical protein
MDLKKLDPTAVFKTLREGEVEVVRVSLQAKVADSVPAHDEAG